MSADTFNSQPDDSELLQVESGPEPEVAVIIRNPVRTQAMPTKAGAAKTIPVASTGQSTRILAADHKRAAATISATAFPVLLSFEPISPSDVTNSFPLPVGVLFGPVLIDTALYALGVGGTASVGTFVEMWAAGDD